MKTFISTFITTLFVLLSFSGNIKAQNSGELYKINFRNRAFTPQKSLGKVNPGQIKAKNQIVQFNNPLTAEKILELKALGIKINGQLSKTTLSIYAEDSDKISQLQDLRWSGILQPQDKISSMFESESGEIYAVANFHRNDLPQKYFEVLEQKGAEVVANNYLDKNDILIKLNKSDLQKVAEIDGIAFIYPASDKIVSGGEVHKCIGVMNEFGLVPEYVVQGNGWDGPGLGSASLMYHFVNGTPDVSGEEAEVVAALETWSKYAQIDWTSTIVANMPMSMDISWGAEEHGDGFPFDGTGNVLAHCFYPWDVVSGSIAGDMHFDEDENWQLGDDVDVFAVALHESGHGLGLNHSNAPLAVMYPYYSGSVADLNQDDINGIRSLYATRETSKTSPPVIDPASGSYASPIEVRLNFGEGSNSQNTRIYYTLDGSNPTSNSYEFVPGNDYIFQRYSNTIKAIAFKTGSTPSDVVSETYILNQANPTVENPVITPDGGDYYGNVLVSMSCPTDFSVIRYTTDGSEPTASSFAYLSPITIVETGTVKAKAFRNDYTPSQTVLAEFNIGPSIPSPTVYPGGGVFNESVTVYMGSTVLGAQIYYTTDGSIPNQGSNSFTSPIVLTTTTQIKAVTIFEGSVSQVVSNWYNINQNATAPIITPDSGNFTGSVDISMSTTTPNGVIRYTTNGAEPTTYSTEYSGTFTLGVGSHTVKAKTFHPSITASETSSVNYNVYGEDGNQVETPVMYPLSTQTFTEPVHITMSCATEDAVIRYTVGFGQLPDDPTATGGGSITYNGPFNIGASGQDMFFKVRAFKNGLTDSEILQSGMLSVTDPLGLVETPTITPNGGVFNNTVKVTMVSATANANVLYTKDGSDPSSNLPVTAPTSVYNSPVTILKSTTIKAKGRRTFFSDSDIAEAQFVLQCGTVEISPDSGSYTDSVQVTFTTITENAKIRYTMDGSEPSDSSEEYAAPLTLVPGSYSIKAKAFKFNFMESETSIAQIEVNKQVDAPVIASHPEDKSVDVGETVKFRITLTADQEYSFQWKRNSVDLPGETADSLEIQNVQEGDAGEYSVKISNSAGSVVSDAAVLTVIPTTGVNETFLSGIPDEFELGSNYPNPFNPSTKIRYALPEKAHVVLQVFNISGELVSTLINSERPAGFYEVFFEVENISSGIYLYRLRTSKGFVQTKKMILLK